MDMTIGKSAFDLPGIWTYLKNLKIEVRWFFHWWAVLYTVFLSSDANKMYRMSIKDAQSYFSKFSFQFHLKNHHSIDDNLNFG